MSDILGPGSKSVGPVEAQARQATEAQSPGFPSAVARVSAGSEMRDFAALIIAHYSELAAFVRDVLTGH